MWHAESKERLGKDCVLPHGVYHLLSCPSFKDLATVNVVTDKRSNHSPDEERVASRPIAERYSSNRQRALKHHSSTALASHRNANDQYAACWPACPQMARSRCHASLTATNMVTWSLSKDVCLLAADKPAAKPLSDAHVVVHNRVLILSDNYLMLLSDLLCCGCGGLLRNTSREGVKTHSCQIK